MFFDGFAVEEHCESVYESFPNLNSADTARTLQYKNSKSSFVHPCVDKTLTFCENPQHGTCKVGHKVALL